eukprot:SAG22_NODE_549_length_9239_cov_7.477899_4_plen_114_part_00
MRSEPRTTRRVHSTTCHDPRLGAVGVLCCAGTGRVHEWIRQVVLAQSLAIRVQSLAVLSLFTSKSLAVRELCARTLRAAGGNGAPWRSREADAGVRQEAVSCDVSASQTVPHV